MEQNDLLAARDRLLKKLAREVQDVQVLAAMGRVPREAFVLPEQADRAYEDAALPIKQGQSISQPLIVALMTQALELHDGDRVLEVGTGVGYQAAVLAELRVRVTTVERRPLLAEEAAARLAALGYAAAVQVQTALPDVLGWPAGAPYDAVIVTAAAPMVPQELLDQVRDGGRIVIPVGNRDEQDLLLVVRRGDMIERFSLGPCRFVPLIGHHAWPDAG